MSRGKPLIYIACGSAAASANLVKERLRELLRKNKIDAELKVMRIAEVAGEVAARRPDLIIITAGSFSKAGIPKDIPVLSGLPLMTMVGVEKFMNEVKSILLKGQ